MSITVKELGKVYRETFDAREKWKNILLDLGLDVSAIDSIGTKFGDKPDDCYREGLSTWLKNGDRSWRDLVEALSSPTVGHKDIAEVIEKNYVREQAVSSDLHQQPITGELVIFTKEQLGNGAFGAVFKGSYRGEPCAVKLLHHVAMHIQTKLPAGQAVEGADRTFDRECEFLKSFQHPHIVKHLSSEKHPKTGNTILVIELMDCNLRGYLSRITDESLSSECQLSFSTDVASGLAFIHSKEVIHRDLCGDNILLKLDGPVPVAKISDFGMSRLLDRSKLSSTLTAMGHRMGYLPPEAARLEEEQYDYSLDVFSLGVIMVQIVLKLETIKTPKDRAEFVEQISDTHVLKPLIFKCLKEDMTKRPSASQVYDELCKGARTASADENETQSPYLQPPPRLTVPSSITFHWEKLWDKQHYVHDLPVAVNGKLYVRGKGTHVVLQYTPGDDHWEELPEPPSVYDFTVATVNGQLLVVGGKERSSKTTMYTNAIFSFNEQSQQWDRFHPPLPVELTHPVAIGYQHYLIVGAGGRSIRDVRILNTATKKWDKVEQLPSCGNYRALIIKDTVYLVCQQSTYIIRAHVPTLISGSGVWEKLPDTILLDSTLVAVNNTLLTVGGRAHLYKNNRYSDIHMYDPTKNQWTKVGDLPKPMYDCHCTVLSGKLIVLGGSDNNSVYVAKLNVVY